MPPFKAALTAALKKADFLFGNETEAAAFAKSEGWEESDVAKIAAKISEIEGEKPRTVVRRRSLVARHPRHAASRAGAL